MSGLKRTVTISSAMVHMELISGSSEVLSLMRLVSSFAMVLTMPWSRKAACTDLVLINPLNGQESAKQESACRLCSYAVVD